MSHLRSVDDQEFDPDKVEASFGNADLPAFEGQQVDFARLKLTSVNDLEVLDEAVHIDDIVKLVCEGRVVRVDHVVDDKTGRLKRVHTVKVLDAFALPWEFEISTILSRGGQNGGRDA